MTRRKRLLHFVLAWCMMLSILCVQKMPAYAAGMTLSLSSTSLNIGDTITATVKVPSGYGATVSVEYDSAILQIASNSKNGAIMNLGDAMGQPTSGTITFTAIAAGDCAITANATVAGDTEGNQVELAGAGARITVANAAGSSTDATGSANGNGTSGSSGKVSADNSLSVLKLSSGTLSPAFSYNVTKYTATVDYSVTSIAITATPTNEKATVTSVTGNENLTVGQNTIKITVKAENGVSAVYTITVTRKGEQDISEPSDQNEEGTLPEEGTAGELSEPTNGFLVDGVLLVPSFEIPQELIPQDFVEATIRMYGLEYPCLNFRYGNITLICLKEAEASQGQLYVYDNSQYAVFPFYKQEDLGQNSEVGDDDTENLMAEYESLLEQNGKLEKKSGQFRIAFYICLVILCLCIGTIVVLVVLYRKKRMHPSTKDKIDLIDI